MHHIIIPNSPMMNYYMENNIILDASYLIALAFSHDPHHKQAEIMLQEIISIKPVFVTNNYLLSEAMTMTLLRSKDCQFVEILKKHTFGTYKNICKVFYINQQFDEHIYNLFIRQEKYRGEFLSFADCSIIIQARTQKIKTIFTFDSTFKQFAEELKIVGI